MSYGYGNEAYIHNGDRPLMKSLGLRTWAFSRDYLDLGTVEVRDADADAPATVKVEVSAMPAQFWRFTVTKTSGIFVMETGSGGFGDYWPIARQIAEGMLYVTKVEST